MQHSMPQRHALLQVLAGRMGNKTLEDAPGGLDQRFRGTLAGDFQIGPSAVKSLLRPSAEAIRGSISGLVFVVSHSLVPPQYAIGCFVQSFTLKERVGVGLLSGEVSPLLL